MKRMKHETTRFEYKENIFYEERTDKLFYII